MFTPKSRLFILIAVAAAIVMNVAQKSLVSYSSYGVYVVATWVWLLLSLLGYFFIEQWSVSLSWLAFSWWMVALWAAIALLNLAYIRIYQSWWPLSWVPLVVTVLMTLWLVVLWSVYRWEQIARNHIVWGVVVLVGLWLLVWKQGV